MATLPTVTWVDSPAALPHSMPEGRFVVVDVAFASLERFAGTERFIHQHREQLAAWVDHHKHEGWPRYAGDSRFLLVPNVVAHACPELVTPEVVRRAGPVARVLAHSDFDGMMSAVCWLRDGQPPYAEALEDARAADSPGRGHPFTDRGRRLYDALEQARDHLHTPQRHTLLTEVALSLVTGLEERALSQRIDALAAKSHHIREKAAELVSHGKEELPGVYVVRHGANLSGRLKKEVLLLAEARASVAAVVEGVGPFHVTAATFQQDLDLSEVSGLPIGRSDYRFVNRIADAAPVLKALGILARPYG